MKNLLSALLCLSLASCAYQPKTQFGKNVAAWWGKPSTQTGLHYVEQAATQFLVNSALAGLQAYAGGGKIDVRKIAMQGGIATLYTSASNIRQLQGTSQVLDPVATARLLEQGGTPEELSRKLAQEIFNNASALIVAGASPNQAAESGAAALDKAAAFLAAETSNK